MTIQTRDNPLLKEEFKSLMLEAFADANSDVLGVEEIMFFVALKKGWLSEFNEDELSFLKKHYVDGKISIKAIRMYRSLLAECWWELIGNNKLQLTPSKNLRLVKK